MSVIPLVNLIPLAQVAEPAGTLTVTPPARSTHGCINVGKGAAWGVDCPGLDGKSAQPEDKQGVAEFRGHALVLFLSSNEYTKVPKLWLLQHICFVISFLATLGVESPNL